MNTVLRYAYYCLLVLIFSRTPAIAEELRNYVDAPNPSFSWEETSRKKISGGTLVTLNLLSQEWRGTRWTHSLDVYIPETRRHYHLGFLLVVGSSADRSDLLRGIGDRAGIIAAVLKEVPNQPLFQDLTEDRLIAYTFDRYRETGESTWPLLFPMVKSVSSAMEALQHFSESEFDKKLEGFVVSGASKRGWTIWLSAAVDSRVTAIAPMVFDMLNMKVQTDWAITSYGAQSEKIKPYTELGLVADIETPPITKLRGWLDPYSYIKSYTQEKLILLGTNDAYWTVDALQHYWPDLPEPKAVYQNPNTEHSLRRARKNWETLASWVQLLADKEPVPRLRWQYIRKPSGEFSTFLSSSASIRSAKLWETTSESRDFRQSRWQSREVQLAKDRKGTTNILVPEAERFKAFFYEVEYTTGRGNKLLFSSQTQVIEPGTQQR